MVGCRTSGVLTASTLVFKGECKLISIHCCSLGAPTTVKVFDGLDNTGKEVARLVLNPDAIIEFDMHGVLCKTGLYVEEIAGGAMATSVEFA